MYGSMYVWMYVSLKGYVWCTCMYVYICTCIYTYVFKYTHMDLLHSYVHKWQIHILIIVWTNLFARINSNVRIYRGVVLQLTKLKYSA